MNKIKLFLSSIGLNNKEIEVYLAGLKIGPAKASLLAKRASITRQHAYDILYSLEKKGLLSRSGKGYGQKFSMENPENIDHVLERGKQKINKLKEKLNNILPEFESFYSAKGIIPKIKFYEEEEGIKEIFEDMLKCRKNEHFYLGSFQELLEIVSKEYLDNWIKRRVKKKIFSKAIRIKEKEIKKIKYTGENKFFREVRFAPNFINITQTVVMYDNKVAVISSRKEHYGFLIESEEYYNTMKMIFDWLWSSSELLKK